MVDFKFVRAAVDKRLVRCVKHPDLDLYLHTHTDKCAARGAWTETTSACRGLILSAGGALVSRPFPKFFEIEQIDPACVRDLEKEEDISVFEKVGGSLGISYFPNGPDNPPAIATKGSFTSRQAEWATCFLREQGLGLDPAYTYLFEIVYPENRILVDYGDAKRLVFLAAIRIADGAMTHVPPHGGGGKACGDLRQEFPEFKTLADVRAAAAADATDREGYVVFFKKSKTMLKVKTGLYKERAVSSHLDLRLPQFCCTPDKLGEVLDSVPLSGFEKAGELITRASALFASRRKALMSKVRATESMTQKEAALFLKGDGDLRVVGNLRKGLNCDSAIWKLVRIDLAQMTQSQVGAGQRKKVKDNSG